MQNIPVLMLSALKIICKTHFGIISIFVGRQNFKEVFSRNLAPLISLIMSPTIH